jgi:hypothetical protein
MRERSFFWRLFEPAPLALWVFLLSLCVSWAQSGNPRIGVLTPGGTFEPALIGLREGLSRYGYKEAKDFNFVLENTKGAVSELGRHANTVLGAGARLTW